MGRKKIDFKKACENCGNEFNPGRHKEKKTCSDLCLKEYKEKNKWSRIKKSKEGLMLKYGVDHPSKIKGFSDKVKSTKQKKYGDENYNNREQAKETCLERYNVDNSLKSKEIQEKSKNTKQEKYGDENFNNREKAKETCLEKYNVEHHLKSEIILNKQKETNKLRNGNEWNCNLEKSLENLKKKNNEMFGSDFFFSSDLHLNKMKLEKLERLKDILKDSNLEFDINQYEKLRTKNEDGSTSYLFYDIKCNSCNNTFKSRLINQIPICRKCNPITSNSKLHLEFKEFLNDIKINFIENNKHTIKPLELDFLIEEKNIAMELNGNYWHSEIGGGKDSKYHINKSDLCNKKNVKLIHILEDEWIFKKDIVKSRIKHIMNMSENVLYARNCYIKEVDIKTKTDFLEKNHIQGNSIDKLRYGLFYKDELISLMTFSKERIVTGNKSKDYFWELNRFCNKINYSVVGGFEKLLSHFKKNNSYDKITTYADCRWSGLNFEKTVYFKNNFKFIQLTRPSYFFVNKKDYFNRMHRFTLAKHELLKLYLEDKNLTGWEIAVKNGYDRIWDCGTMKFELNKL